MKPRISLPKPHIKAPHINPEKLFAPRTEKIITLCVRASVIAGFWIYKRIAGISLTELFGFVYELIHDTWRGPLALVGLYGMRPLVLFPPTGLLSMFIGAVFGFWPGIVFAYLGDNLGAVTGYRIGRYFGNHVLRNKEEVSIRLFSYHLHMHPFVAVFITRLSFIPDDIITYSRGYLQAPRKMYMLGTLAGNVFFTTLSVLIGASIENIAAADFSKLALNEQQLVRALIAYGILLLIGVWLGKKAGRVERG